MTFITSFLLPRYPFSVSFFHSTPSRSQRPDHKLYKELDWDTIRSGKYAVVDPLDPHSILYLSVREYLVQSRVAISNDVTLIVLATPSSEPIDLNTSSPSKNSPPKAGVPSVEDDFSTKIGRTAQLRYLFTTPFLHWTESRPEAEDKEKTRREDLMTTVTSSGKSIRSDAAKASAKSDTLSVLDSKKKQYEARKFNHSDAMITVNKRNFVHIIRKWGEILAFRIFGLAAGPGFDGAVGSFSAHLLQLYSNNGIQFVIIRLKIYLHLVLAYCSGEKITSTEKLGARVRISHGLPSCLPSTTRHAIRSKSLLAIRAWTSLLGMYKGLKGVWDYPDYRTITQPPLEVKGNSVYDDFCYYCQGIFLTLLPGYRNPVGFLFTGFPIPSDILKTQDTYISTKGGPNGKSLSSSHWDLVAWLVRAGHELGYFKGKEEEITVRPPVTFKGTMEEWLRSEDHPFKVFLRWCTLNLDVIFPRLPWGKIMLKVRDIRLKHAITNLIFKLETLDLAQVADIPGNPITTHINPITVRDPWTPKSAYTNKPKWAALGSKGGLNLAKLVSLFEPAGKVRNIVMFDWVSQQVLLPFHNFMFDLLYRIKCDATFDQQGPVKAFSEREYVHIYSYDLKAATETMSVCLYRAVLGPILGPELTELWIDLLTDRDVMVADGAPVNKTGTHIRYTRGQPMGALSSWASMALLHHAIVQFAAHRVFVYGLDKGRWFEDYLVLGDDIVIANKQVADEYVDVCSSLGIRIGLPKSFESVESFFNFAGQSFMGKHNISPISFKEEITCRSPGARLEMAFRLLDRGFISLTSGSWLAPLLRAVLPRNAYKRSMDYLHAGKGVHHGVIAVLVATFGQLDRFFGSSNEAPLKRLADQGLSVYGYFALYRAKASLFSKPLETLVTPSGGVKDDPSVNELVLSLLAHKAKDIYRRFMALHPVLKLWKTSAQRASDGRVTNPYLFFPDMLTHVAPLLWPYRTFGKRIDELLEWETLYRRFVKTINVAYSLQPITVDLLEHTLECSIIEAWERLLEAENALPLSPDTILLKDGKVIPASPDEIYHQAEKRFTRWANQLEMSNAVQIEPAFSRRSGLIDPEEEVIASDGKTEN